MDVDLDMVYVIAAYHDLGYSREPDDHEMISSKMFQKDEKMKDFFGEEQRNIIAEAILDHRASLEYEPRSIYGKIVSSADREVLVSNMLRRSILFQREKHKSENLSWEQIMDYSYKKLSSKYGKGGYAKMYFPDEKYLSYIKRMQELLENKEDFF